MGHQAQSDVLTGFFENLLDGHDLISIDSVHIMPTWRNHRMGEDALARRLDSFLIKFPLLNRQWVGWGDA